MSEAIKNDENKKRRPINISNEAYLKSREIVEREGKGTLVEYVNETLLKNAERDHFLKLYALYIKEDYISEDAVYLKDSKLNKIAIVRLKEYPDEDLDNSGYYGFCETCLSDSCIHVRHSLVTGSLMTLKLSDKMA
jgi:hypothetical protein